MAKLEEERRLNLNRNSALAKVGTLKQSDFALGIVRCPKCTLYVPCSHFKDIKEIGFGDLNLTSKLVLSDIAGVFARGEWKTLREDERINVKAALNTLQA